MLLSSSVWAQKTSRMLRVAGKQPALGQGYDPQTENFKFQCIKSENYAYSPVAQSTLGVGIEISNSALETEFGFETKSRARLGLSKVSAQSDYLKKTRTSNYSHSVHYKFDGKASQVSFDQQAKSGLDLLTPQAVKLLDTKGNLPKITADFITLCGSEVVTAIDRGFKLYVSVSVSFSDSSSFAKFGGSASLSGGWGSIEATIKNLSHETRRNGSISVIAYQLGGSPDELSKIFKSRSGTSNIISCSMSNIDACKSVFSDVFDYASGEFIQQTVSKDYSPKTSISGVANLVYYTEDWQVFGIQTTKTVSNSELDRQRKNYFKLYEDELKKSTAVKSSAQSGVAILSKEERVLYEKAQEIIEDNIEEILSKEQNCFDIDSTDDKTKAAEYCKKAVNALTKHISDSMKNVPDHVFLSAQDKCGSSYCKSCVNLGTFSKPKFTCLKCEATINDIYGKAFELSMSSTHPTFTCNNMPTGKTVTVSVDGKHGNCGWKGTSHGNWYGEMFLNIIEPSGYSGDSAYIRAENQTGARHRANATMSVTVGDSGTITADLSDGTCQAANTTVDQQIQVLDPDFYIGIAVTDSDLKQLGGF